MLRDKAEIARLWMAGMNEHGLPPLDLCHEQIEIVNVKEFMVQGTYSGHPGVRRWAVENFDVLSEARFDLEEVIDTGDGETLVTVQRAVGQSAHSGLEIDLSWAALWIIRDGTIVRITGYRNKAEAMTAVEERECRPS